MRPYKQGAFSRYCSIYSTLNVLQALGVKLKYEQWQELYDYLIFGINYFDALYEMNACGLDHKRLEVIFKYASEWLRQQCQQKLFYTRPFWNVRMSVAELNDYIKQQSSNGKVTLIRIKSEKIDHYSVIKRITKDKVTFYDSSELPNIALKNISTDSSRKYQICLRQVYFISLEGV